MREKIEARVSALKKDFEAGQQRLGNLERECAGIRETLLRISGAIQVLEETIAEDDGQVPQQQAAE